MDIKEITHEIRQIMSLHRTIELEVAWRLRDNSKHNVFDSLENVLWWPGGLNGAVHGQADDLYPDED